MAAEAGHATSRIYTDQNGNFHLNGASFFNDAESDISASLEVLNDLAPGELSFLDGVTAGTATESKAVVLGASKEIATITSATITTLTTTTVAAAGAITSSSPTTGIGYATGAGGTVTQATDKTTGVALSKACGQITMNNAQLDAGVIVSFVLTNTAIAATDVLVLNHVSGGTVGSYSLNAQCGAGSATINVRNNTAGNLSEAIVISYALVKGVTA